MWNASSALLSWARCTYCCLPLCWGKKNKYKKQIEQALQGNAAVVQLASVGVTLATVLRVVVEICHSIVSEATWIHTVVIDTRDREWGGGGQRVATVATLAESV